MNKYVPVVLFTIIILASAVFFGLNRREQSRQIDRNTKALIALCALRLDLDSRIESSQVFLDKHPHGIPGIPAAVIRQSLVNSRRTREALSVLDC